MTIPLPENLPYSRATDRVVNLAGSHPFEPDRRDQPRDKQSLVDVVAAATLHNRELRAIGSAWSFSQVTEADNIIDTMFLRYHLSPPHGATAMTAPERIRPDSAHLLQRFCAAAGPETAGRKFVHVEAGVKIWMLLADLKMCGLALPTMGAGGGQSLAGALATGSHGADFRTPPLVEWIRAIHLIGPAGREWWLTPSRSFLADREILRAGGWPESGEMVADDDVFDAVRVGLGRFGVIYSFVLEVVEPYSLLEITQRGSEPRIFRSPSQVIDIPRTTPAKQVFTNPPEHHNSWRTVRSELQQSGVAGGELYGPAFEAPITNFREGWLRKEVADPTITAIEDAFFSQRSHGLYERRASNVDPIALSLALEFFGSLNGKQQAKLGGVPADGEGRSLFEAFGILAFALEKLGLAGVAAGLEGGPQRPLRHLNVVLPLMHPDICWVTRRWAIADPLVTANLDRTAPDEVDKTLRLDIDHELRDEARDPSPILQLISKQVLEAVVRGVMDESKQWFLAAPIPLYWAYKHIVDPLTYFLIQQRKEIRDELRPVNGWSAEGLFLLLYRLLTRTGSEIREVIRPPLMLRAAGIVGNNAFVNPVRAGESCDTLDVHGYFLDYNTPGDSAEYSFDAATTGYLEFIDEVLALALAHDVLGYLGVRFTPRSSALLAMQRYDATASVEIATLRAQTEPLYAPFWSAVHASASDHLGIPHWGQEFVQSAESVRTDFGERLDTWRTALSTLSADGPRVFSTPLTRELGLEPAGEYFDALTAFLMALDGGGRRP